MSTLTAPPARYRAHTTGGTKTETTDERAGRSIAASAANVSAAPVALERWDGTRQQWVLAELIEPQP
jgi:hypothetical protein